MARCQAGLSVLCSVTADSVPSLVCSRASPVGDKSKASCNWLFGCLSAIRNTSYSPLHLTPIRRPFGPSGLVALLCPLLTSASRSGSLAASSVRPVRTRSRPPEVSSTAFRAQPPNLRSAPLMDMDFMVSGPLVRCSRLYSVPVHRLAHLLHASFRHCLTTMPLRFANPSPPSGWVRTSTSKLLNTLGSPPNRQGRVRDPPL